MIVDDTFLVGSGEMGALFRAIDWRATPFGPLSGWPQSLRTTMGICLSSRFPIAVYWGPDYLLLYNQSLVPMVGASKHPHALGQPARIVLAEIWSIIEPLLRHVRTTGEATWSEDLMLPLARTGAPEESYFTFTYSPIRDETTGVGGVFCAVVETTEKVIEGRRLRLFNALADAGRAPGPAQACEHLAAAIGGATDDVPFALLYLLDDGGVATLAGAANIVAGSPLAPLTVRPGDETPWRFDGIDEEPRWVALDDGPSGTRNAVVLPITQARGGRRFGMLVAGLAPMLSQSESYLRFQKLLAAAVAQSVSSAAAYEQERRRAESLAELDRLKSAFFSNVSHEFRTPLTLMLGPAEDALAGAENLSAAEHERWLLVHRNARRLQKLITTLLDFSRLEAGRLEAALDPTDLPAFTGELVSMFRSAVERNGLALRLDLQPLTEPAWIDRDMWEKVVLNLLSNALKFTFEGEIAVSLSLVDAGFELIVRDTGVGIAADELPRVFDRFHRIRGARARTDEGTGIGLALVSELVKLQGGTVRVESTEGRGTTFTVLVPRGHRPLLGVGGHATPSDGALAFVEEAFHWTSPAPSPSGADRADPPNTGPRPRIVLADDNADMREYLRRLLTERWDVEAVSDGVAALAAVRRRAPELVLTDVMMPGLDGFGLLRALRSDPELRRVPVILLSARAGEEATAEGLCAGANDYVVKPFSARDLLVRVASTLAVARVAREAHAIEEAARKRLYGHFMQAPFPVAVFRGEHHVIELANPSALEAWGKDETIVGKPLIHAIPELRGQRILGDLDEVRRTGVAHQARGELAQLVREKGRDPEDVYFDFVHAPLRDEGGSVDGILVAGFVVTPQVRAAQDLTRLLAIAETSERQFRELVENLPDLAWTARPDGSIDYYNRRWYDYTGMTFETMRGGGWRTVHDPALVDIVSQQWQHSIETGQPFEMEFPIRRADGVFRWFLTRVRPLHDLDGRIVRWFGANTDIDDRRRNEDFREMFLGILGHDLRNPLSTILTTAEILVRRADTPPEIRTRMERVVSSSARIGRMITQLLDLTRARLGGGIPLTLSVEAVDLTQLVTRMADELRASAPSVTIVVRVRGDCSVRIDPDRFEQVVSNLLGNAAIHGDRTRPIEVELASQPEEVTLVVRNYGEPIDPKLLPLLFNPFARAERSSARLSPGQVPRAASDGLGLGLYIAERIVDAHQGRLMVRSSREAGTHLEVTLPRSP